MLCTKLVILATDLPALKLARQFTLTTEIGGRCGKYNKTTVQMDDSSALTQIDNGTFQVTATVVTLATLNIVRTRCDFGDEIVFEGSVEVVIARDLAALQTVLADDTMFVFSGSPSKAFTFTRSRMVPSCPATRGQSCQFKDTGFYRSVVSTMYNCHFSKETLIVLNSVRSSNDAGNVRV